MSVRRVIPAPVVLSPQAACSVLPAALGATPSPSPAATESTAAATPSPSGQASPTPTPIAAPTGEVVKDTNPDGIPNTGFAGDDYPFLEQARSLPTFAGVWTDD